MERMQGLPMPIWSWHIQFTFLEERDFQRVRLAGLPLWLRPAPCRLRGHLPALPSKDNSDTSHPGGLGEPNGLKLSPKAARHHFHTCDDKAGEMPGLSGRLLLPRRGPRCLRQWGRVGGHTRSRTEVAPWFLPPSALPRLTRPGSAAHQAPVAPARSAPAPAPCAVCARLTDLSSAPRRGHGTGLGFAQSRTASDQHGALNT